MQNETRPIIRKGTVYKAIWDGKEQDITAETDRITIPLGDYNLMLEKCK